jgi:hypothetical protein
MAVLLKVKTTRQKLLFFKKPKMLFFAFFGLKTTDNRSLLDKFVVFQSIFCKKWFF